MRAILRSLASRLRSSDEQHVERIRRNVARFDRWRRPLILFSLLQVVIFAVVLIATSALLDSFSRDLGIHAAWRPGFIVGLVTGLPLGVASLVIGHGLTKMLLGYRTERLLLQYHDGLDSRRHADGALKTFREREAEDMRRPRLRYVIVVGVASLIPLAGLIWSLIGGKRNAIVAPQRAEKDVPNQEDSSTQLQQYRAQVIELARKEYRALGEVDREAETVTKNRSDRRQLHFPTATITIPHGRVPLFRLLS